MGLFVVVLYGLGAIVGLTNLLLMRRPGRREDGPSIVVLIPARDEEANLQRLIPALLGPNPGLKVIVCDDESTDATAAVAQRLGAEVIQPTEKLPPGWTGKNRACHLLAQVAAETDAEWFLFLDADIQPEPGLIPAVRGLCCRVKPQTGVVTGFPTILPGRGIEPLFLCWVGWVLLTTNPYGLVSRTGKGHNMFTNGQIHCWRREVYLRLLPNERMRDHVMEDVAIGRMLGKEKVGVEVANLASVFSVRMYETWRQTLDGMSKNSHEIAGNDVGSVLVALMMLFCGWGWLLGGAFYGSIAYGLFLLGGVCVVLIARSSAWPLLVMPLVPTIGAYTIIRSMLWHRRGEVVWKGRIYPGRR